MNKRDEVRIFLADFKVKMRVFEILYRDDRPKNVEKLFQLGISRLRRREIIESLMEADFVEGPKDDRLYGIASMWVFGISTGAHEIYIKISMGLPDQEVICISFHEAEHKLHYPFKIK